LRSRRRLNQDVESWQYFLKNMDISLFRKMNFL